MDITRPRIVNNPSNPIFQITSYTIFSSVYLILILSTPVKICTSSHICDCISWRLKLPNTRLIAIACSSLRFYHNNFRPTSPSDHWSSKCLNLEVSFQFDSYNKLGNRYPKLEPLFVYPKWFTQARSVPNQT